MKAPCILIFFFCKACFLKYGESLQFVDLSIDCWMDGWIDVWMYFFVFGWFCFIVLIKDNGFFPPFNPLLEKKLQTRPGFWGHFLDAAGAGIAASHGRALDSFC